MSNPTTHISIHESEGQQAVILMTSYVTDNGDSTDFNTKAKIYLAVDGELVEQELSFVDDIEKLNDWQDGE